MTTAYETDGPHSSYAEDTLVKRDVAPIDRALLDLDGAIKRIDDVAGQLRDRLDPILRRVPDSEPTAMAGHLQEVAGPSSIVTERIRESIIRSERIADHLDAILNRIEV